MLTLQARSFTSPRAFLLAIRPSVPSHSLLVCSWGKEGAAILSVPTREYFQSSPFVPDPAEEPDTSGVASVRSSSAEYSGWSTSQPSDWDNTTGEFWNDERRRRWVQEVASPMSSGQPSEEEEELDETEAEDAFTAGTRLLGASLGRFGYDIDVCLSGMIFALSRRILPGLPYSPYRPPPESAAAEQQESEPSGHPVRYQFAALRGSLAIR